jgi:peptide/nickel transport system substrate-binding protein
LKLKYIFGILLISLFIFQSSGGFAQAKPAQDEWKGLVIPGNPDSFDPAIDYETRGGFVTQSVYETLLTYDGNSTTLVPNLASELPVVSSDAKSFTYKLRNDVDFTDGVHFDAYVMKYSIDRAIIMNNPDGPAWMISQAIAGAADYAFASSWNKSTALTYLAADGVEIIDQYTIKFSLDTAYVAFEAAMTFPVGSAVSPLAVISNMPTEWTSNSNISANLLTLADIFPDTTKRPSWFSNFTSAGIVASPDVTNHPWMDTHAVGTGPFKLASYEVDVGISLERNEDWWVAKVDSSKLPKIKTISSNIVQETGTRLLAMQNGEADSGQIPATNYKDIYNRDTGKVNDAYKNLQVHFATSYSVTYAGFNVGDINTSLVHESIDSNFTASNFDRYGPDNPDNSTAFESNPFSALKFRQAMSFAFNYTGYIETVLSGYGERMVGVIPNGLAGHVSDLDLPEYNLAAAQTLFEEVGWKGEIVLGYNAGNVARQAAVELLEDAVEGLDVGIEITANPAEWTTFLALIRAGQAPMSVVGWAPDYADADNYVDPFLNSAGTLAKRQNYVNTHIDDLIASEKTETNAQDRLGIFQEIEEAAAGDLPILYLYQVVQLIITQNNVRGIEGGIILNPMFNGFSWELFKQAPSIPGFEFVVLLTILVGVAIIRRKK